VGDGLADQRLRFRHLALILGRASGQVNEAALARQDSSKSVQLLYESL
jgi:hypothetical protein